MGPGTGTATDTVTRFSGIIQTLSKGRAGVDFGGAGDVGVVGEIDRRARPCRRLFRLQGNFQVPDTALYGPCQLYAASVSIVDMYSFIICES
ncbi:unnamed protein product, partial [Iphiclides podalirius]